VRKEATRWTGLQVTNSPSVISPDLECGDLSPLFSCDEETEHQKNGDKSPHSKRIHMDFHEMANMK
jgi:hypothetical protein